jgi:protoheme IX farnesyltransferase
LPRPRLADYVELTKPRITFMVVVSAAAGFYLGVEQSLTLLTMLHCLIGTALVASGASALNQLIERDSDALMHRTRNRPLPSGRMDFTQVLAFGLVLSLAGTSYLCLAVNPLTGALAALTLGLYVVVYTPMKRVSSLCTVVGAVPGALPPVMGWAAAAGNVPVQAWVLFAILFFWQLPHFLAIAWAYRDDYARGGQPMLPVIDTTGVRTGRQIVLYCLALLPISLTPALLQVSGETYFWGALALGIGYLAAGLYAAQQRSIASARLLLRVSVVYLPLLLALMALDKVAL